jgi:hypothetical protein
MDDEKRFHELAHKALANEAQPAEQAELRALIAENPKLKEEFERMRAETAAAREILPLLEDVQHPQGNIPRAPMRRLQKEIREVFEQRSESKIELRELLARLEKWTVGQFGIERERVMHLVSLLQHSLGAGRSEPADTTDALREADFPNTDFLAFVDPEPSQSPATGKLAEARGPEADLVSRLRSLEVRIRHAEQINHECRQELGAILGVLTRDWQTTEQRPTQNPKPSTEK